MYSLNQITWGSLIGGPLAGAWMISRNYLFMDMPEMYSRARIIGFSLAAIALIVVIYLPEDIPGIAIAMSLVLLVRLAAEGFQKKYINNRESSNISYTSNLSTAGVGLASLILSAVFIFTYFFIMVLIAPDLLPSSLFEDI